MLLILGLLGIYLIISFFEFLFVTVVALLVLAYWLFGSVGFFITLAVLFLLIGWYKCRG